MGEETFYVYNKSLGLNEEISNSIIFNIENKPYIVLKNNGDIIVKDKIIENDIELVNAFREFLKQTGYLNK